MSLPRFFLEKQVLSREHEEVFALALSKDDAKHAAVLRLEPGEHIAVIDAQQDYFECEVQSFDQALFVKIARHAQAEVRGPEVVLLQGLCKGDKMDLVIRHATELGVSQFVPLLCKRSVVKLDAKKTASRLQRWQTIAKSAAMQSGQNRIPEVLAPMNCAQAAKLMESADALFVCWEEERQTNLPEAMADLKARVQNDCSCAKVFVAIGPEGGFAEEEVQALQACCSHSFSISLGPSILRTETAGIVAPALVLYELGGLQ